MNRLFALLKSRLNTWDEICENEDARLRTNTILFSFLVTCFYLFLLIADLVAGETQLLLIPILLVLAGLACFLLQTARPVYSIKVAHLFGLLALAMCIYLLYTGAWGGYSFMWIFLIPQIAALVYPQRHYIRFNIVLLVIVCLITATPVFHLLRYPYHPYFRVMLPLALILINLVVLLAEGVRARTQQRLNAGTAKLRAYAFTDPLTGVYNRRAMVQHLGKWDSPAPDYAFAILDLDHFKTVNDRFGHMVGDEVLCHVVAQIQTAAPTGALLYRWGGEEFCLVLKSDDCRRVYELMQTLCRKIATAPMPFAGGAIAVTVSIGAVCAGSSRCIQECLAIADKCLYRAKANGRNQVVVAGLETDGADGV